MNLIPATVLLPEADLARVQRLRTRGPKILSLAAVLRAVIGAGLEHLDARAGAPELAAPAQGATS